MRILVVSDEESKSLWDYYDESKLKGIDLILSCGDVSPSICHFWLHFHARHFSMYMEITIPRNRKDVSALKIRFIPIRVFGS